MKTRPLASNKQPLLPWQQECCDLYKGYYFIHPPPRRKRPPKVFNTAPLPGPGSANQDVPAIIVHNVGVQATDDDAQLFYSVEEEVEEISKALELPDLDAEDSDCGSDFEFS